MQTLSQQYPDAYRNLKLGGFSSICEMLERFYRGADMDRALGHNGATSNWMRQTAVPSRASELKAATYLRENTHSRGQHENTEVLPVVEPPKPVKTDATFLVVAPHEKASKTLKVLALMGCEVVEV